MIFAGGGPIFMAAWASSWSWIMRSSISTDSQERRRASISFETAWASNGVRVPSATEAVKQWIYKPTLLNGDAVEVLTTIDVNFTLSQ